MIEKDNMQKNVNTDADLYLSNHPIHCNLGLLTDMYSWPELLTYWLVTCDDMTRLLNDFMTMITLDVYCGGD